jgi:hypothetical protein
MHYIRILSNALLGCYEDCDKTQGAYKICIKRTNPHLNIYLHKV